MNKHELRQKLLLSRKTFSSPEKNTLILKNLLSLKEFKEADLILTYISKENEISTLDFINQCFILKKRVAAPLTGVDEIEFREFENLSDTEMGKFGIREPLKTCKLAQISKGTFCVVPALACNKRGFRLGYGKGYYDRFLNSFSGTSAVLCYEENIIEIPVENHDRAADIIITEGGVFYGR
jgi:5-formyltetrahydrofolate cyclo-ligase